MKPTSPMPIPRSAALFDRALELIPAGTQLISRRPSMFANGITPIYAERAKGSHIWDVDGGEYIDWGSSCGAIILGYGNDAVDAAVKEQIDLGTIYTINCELEIELAEELVRTIPCAEMVRYTKGGGEACALAVRIARGATGRDKILFCGYHGWHDWYIAAGLSEGTLDAHLFPGIDPIGVPQALADTIEPFEYGSIHSLQGRLDANRGEVAGIIMEPIRSQVPPEGYLQAVRGMATDHGVVLIFDEVSTGLRPALGGAQELLGITPDMAAFAKSMSNGYPMGAVVGKREFMEPAARMFISSSYWSDCVGIAASLATYREMRRLDGPAQCQRTGADLKARINDAIDATGLPAECTGFDFHPTIHFDVEDSLVKAVTTLFIQEMSKRGCIGYAAFYVNVAHTSEDLERTAVAAGEAFEIIKAGLDRGNVEGLLECDLRADIFRRLVR